MLEKIQHNNQLLSIIVRNDFCQPGITFFTPNDFSQQLAFMKHPAGKTIDAHVHKPVEGSVP